MKTTAGLRKQPYVARVSVFLITVALVAGMVGFPVDLELVGFFRHGPGISKVCGAEVTTMAQSSGNITTYEGDLVIDGYEEFVIENCTWIQKGNIVIEDNGKLTVSDTVIGMSVDYWLQREIIVRDQGSLNIVNGRTLTDLPMRGLDYARLTITSSEMVNGSVWAGGSSQLKVTDSFIQELRVSDQSRVTVLNSHIGGLELMFLDSHSAGEIHGLVPGLIAYWNLHENETVTNVWFDVTLTNVTVDNWALFLNHLSAITVSESSIERITLDFGEASDYIEHIEAGFHRNLNLGSLIFNNTSVGWWEARVFGDAILTIEDSTIGLVLHGDSKCTALNSRISSTFILYFLGEIHFDEIAVTNWVVIRDSEFLITGNAKFSGVEIRVWVSSVVTRDYEVVVKDRYGDIIPAADLTLTSEDGGTQIWHGTTDSQGRASFDLTFTDGNYTDTLRLEAVKGNLFDAQDITFLSDTPIILTALVQYNLTTSSTVGGNVTAPGQGTFTYDEGKVVNLVANPASGHKFVKWTGDVDDVADVNDATTTITMNGDYSITANFERIPEHTLTISSGAGGSVTIPGEGDFTYEEGTVVGLEAKPDEGYQFVSWTGDVDTVANVNAASTTITINDDYSITANFEAVGGCFIATAAYGTPMAEQIQVLREFRDEYLLTSRLGQVLVDAYYTISPPIADFIAEHPRLKPIVRAGLLPVVATCRIFLDIAA